MRRITPVTLTAFALTSVAAATDPGGNGEVIWDNGLSFQNGVSHLSGQGQRRSVLDDFVLGPLGESIWAFQLKFAWADGTTGRASDLELVFYGDAGGRPDFDSVVAVATNRTYTETRDPNNPNFFGLTVVDIWVQFDKLLIDPGTYWVDMHVVGPVNGFQVIGEYPQHRGAPVWVDYEDFGGRQPGENVFGDRYDVNFQIISKRIPAPGTIALLTLAGIAGPRRRRG